MTIDREFLHRLDEEREVLNDELNRMLDQAERGEEVDDLEWRLVNDGLEIVCELREAVITGRDEPEHDAGWIENEMYDQLRRGEG